MIAFSCKKCGKRDRRSESESGTLVFCTCGHSHRVPWSSEPGADVPEPIPALDPVPLPRSSRMPQVPQIPKIPILDAQPVPDSSRRQVPTPAPAQGPRSSVVDNPLTSRRPGRLLGKINPKFCYHHDDAPSETTCSACKLPFCASCVVMQQGEQLCGPCKNFRLAALGRPDRVLPLSVVALVVALSGGPVALILSLVGVGLYRAEAMSVAAIALCLVGAVLPIVGLTLARIATRRLDAATDIGGRSLAAGATCLALVELVWCAAIASILLRQTLL